MALPAVFDPVEDGDRLLVDGGVLMNVPVSVGKEMGADIIIAVDVGSPLEPKENVNNLLKVLYQLTGVVTVENTRQQLALLGDDDFIVKPPISDEITTGSFARAAEAIPAGYTETMKLRAELETLSVSQLDWDRRLTRIAGCVDGAPTIEFLRVNNQSRYSDEVINMRLDVDIGHVLDIPALEAQLSDIYALGFLQSVSYQIIHEGDRIGVQVDVMPDTRGTSFFEYGIGLNSTDFSSSFNLRLGYLRTHIDGYGGEFRALLQLGEDFGIMTELYKPLGPGLRWIFLPRIAVEKSDLNIFDDNGNRLFQVGVKEAIMDVGFGRVFGNNGMIRAGVRVGGGHIEMNIGDPTFEDIDFGRGEVYLSGNYDTQDNRYFPGSGSRAYLTIGQSRKSLGADEEFEQIRGNWIKAWTHGRHSYLASAEIGLSSDDAIPVQHLFRLGGFPRMSGYNYNELLGENIYLGIAGYRYKMLEGSILPGYLGATFEVGNASSSRDQLFDEQIFSGSLYFGIDSLIGPLYIGVGIAEGGRYLPFLTIGSIFSRDSLTRRN
jgi:NTE family protein